MLSIPDEISQPIHQFFSNNIIIISLILLFIAAFVSVIFLGNDNSIEQGIEKVIEAESGIKIDLT